MTAATADSPRALHATHALLAFDDFSLAGRHLLKHVDVDAHRMTPVALPPALAGKVEAYQYCKEGSGDEKATLAIVEVESAALDGAALWQLADALVQFLSDRSIDALTVVASLHLPQAKPKPSPLDNVYSGAVFSTSEKAAGAALQPFDASWEIKDAFLTRFLHFARIEQAFTTQLVAMKGYKPGRDGAGAREAIETLSTALPLLLEGSVAGASVDTQRAMTSAYKALSTRADPRPQHELNMLYQ